ncbi:MAG TPA: carbohydrate-binding family V/XII, partial [Candidatus Angelobacter sp.]|nr:carbohydrate-binding family V/XII [Candidatus Angelobacter sp.]
MITRLNRWFHLLALVMMTCPAAARPQTLATPVTAGQDVTPGGDELTWPREFVDNGTKVDIYQPQIEQWEGTNFQTRSAVAITPAGSNAPVYGVFWMTARADVDKAARIVTLNDIQVTKASFPSALESQSEYLALIREHVPTITKTVALDHLEACFAVSEAVKNARKVPVKNDPPRIFTSTRPALLVLVDGPPALRPMPGLNVERVINSRALILQVDGVFYLSASGHWYQAVDINGPWTLSASTPPVLAAAMQDAVASQNVDLMPPDPNAVTTTPAVFVSTEPAELIQTEGQANLVPIEGTDLMQVQNSDNALFFNDQDQSYYVLISGRWFKAGSLQGPWAFVPYEQLPADFAKIPPTHPKANVLVSVPGTPQANEAVIANSIPQTATVDRSQASLLITYDGAPQFSPIYGTPLLYAVNTATPVIEVDPNSFYSVENGVWFAATSPAGPWVAATSVPAVIYSIPVSSPLHYVTYVQVYGSTPDVVYDGYTPGYLGTEVCPDNVVVYGTGWYYPPYIGDSWYGLPCTYGFGAGFADNWGIGFGFGFSPNPWLGTWCRPWWGPFGWGWHHHFDYLHVSLNHTDFYHHWGGGVVHYDHNYG